MARTNLSLGNLYRAVSGSVRTSQAVSVGQLGGNTANSAFTSFSVDSITVTPPTYTYIVESTTENAQFSFTTTGSLFYSKVQPQANNYTCSVNNANFTIGAKTLTTGPSVFPLTAASIGTTTYAEASSGLTMSYADGYNINATNYNTPTTKVIYAVDVYNTINQPDFCLLFGTKVLLANGSEIPVEGLRIGDAIKAWVPDGLPDESLPVDTAETEWRFYHSDTIVGSAQGVIVKNLTFNFTDSYVSLNNGLLEATATHPVYVWNSEIEKYAFKTVGALVNGDRLVQYTESNGTTEIEITNVETIVSDVEIVTVDVEQSDVFLSNNLISHNKGTATQPHIPDTSLKMYIEPAKSGSFAANSFPSTGTLTVDILDLAGYSTGLRPGAQAPLSGASPTFNAGASRKERYLAFNGTTQFLYKDTASNINGGYTNFNTNTGTIHLWVRPTTTLGTTTRNIFDYAGYYGLAIESSNSSTLDRVKFYGSSLGNSAQLTTSLSSNVWYLISVAFQPSGTCTIYVDGASVGTFSSSAFTAPASTNYVTIGSNSGRTIFWNGQIGPVLFYNTLQTATLVQQVYNHFSPSYK
jgi:hypothetical protein